MMWHEVMERIIAIVRADDSLAMIYGGQLRQANAIGDFAVPGLEWTLIGDSETEIWEPVVVQFDQWVRKEDDLVRSERRLRGLFHKDLQFEVDNLLLWGQYLDGTSLPAPARSGVIGRALRFRFTPYRQQYGLPVHGA